MFFFIRKIFLLVMIAATFFGLYKLWKYKPKKEKQNKNEWDDF